MIDQRRSRRNRGAGSVDKRQRPVSGAPPEEGCLSAIQHPRPGYNGLLRPEPTLPGESYFSDAAFEADLARIWQRNWVYVCRGSELAEPLSFRTFRLGSQKLLIVRGDDGEMRAFANTR